MIQYLNNDWQFVFDYNDEFLTDKKFEKVRIPHTVKEIDYNYINENDYQTVCGYKRNIFYQKEFVDKRIFLNFDGVGHLAEVYLNKELIIKHDCGYTGFKVEITDKLIKGNNQLFVKVDTRESLNIPPFGKTIDYLCYGGIYRDVYLRIENKNFIEDVYAYPLKKDNKYYVANDISINGEKGIIRYELLDGKRIIVKGETKKHKFNFEVDDIKQWSIEEPYLYSLRYYLNDDENYYETKIGFKTMEFKADGFYLNEQKVKLLGLDRHQSYPYVGYAMPDSMQKLDAHILKDQLSLNIVRTSHYPQAHSFLDECDKIGLLVLTELPGWQYIGDKKWQDVAVKNVEEMVKQYRRHPSIMLWGVRINESKDNDALYKRTNKVAHQFDPYRPTTGIRDFEGSNLLEDVYAHNDFSYNGTELPGLKTRQKAIGKKENMDHGYIVTEYCGHIYPTKSFDDEIHRTNHALRHAKVINSMYEQEDIGGCIGWCMADYNTHRNFGAGDSICYHGVLDMFRNPKLASYVYSSQQDKTPVLEISSELNIGEHPEGNIKDVYLFSNADSIRVYKNDKFVSELKPSKEFKYMKHPLFFLEDHMGALLENECGLDAKSADLLRKAIMIIKYEGLKKIPDSLIKKLEKNNITIETVNAIYGKYVCGWGDYSIKYRFEAIKNGKVIKTVNKAQIETLHLDVQTSSNQLLESKSYDVAELFIRVLDNNNNVAEYYQETLNLSTAGPIEIIGPKSISLKAGQIGVYVKSTGKKGEASLIIESGRFGKKKVKFKVEIQK